MKAIMNKKITSLCILLISVGCNAVLANSEGVAGAGTDRVIESKNSISASDAYALKPVAHKELLNILEQAEKGQNSIELVNSFRQHQKAQKLEAVAYCLKENKHISQVVLKICTEKPLQDKHLAPYLADAMQKIKGRDLINAAKAAQRIPDIILVEPLLNYAVDSEYSEWIIEGPPGRGAHARLITVFEYAADAIFEITRGKIGKYDPTVPKETQIQQWRQAWPEVKKEMLEEIEAKKKVIHPVAHQELLDIFAKAEGNIDKSEYTEILKNYKLNDKLETIAYALEHGLYPDSLRYMSTLQDKRLVPFIAQAIKDSNGKKLLSAVQLAEGNPDTNLLTFLMKYALDSDYVQTHRYGSGNNDVIYFSVFGSAAKAIYTITEGKIGSIQYSSTRKEIFEEEKHTMIEQWHKIYEETLKQEYEPSNLVLPDTPTEPNNPVNQNP